MSEPRGVLAGSHGDYRWLTISNDLPCALIGICPEIVIGKYVLVASFDSGPFFPTKEETAEGWKPVGNKALSPRVADTREIPYAEWSEYYVFAEPVNLEGSAIETFVNYGGFGPDWPRPVRPDENGHPTRDSAAERELQNFEGDLIARFWSQLDGIGAESYFCDNDRESFATKNRKLFERVRMAVEAQDD